MEKFICRKRNYKDCENDTNEFVPKSSVEPDSPSIDNKMQNYLLVGKYFNINSVNDIKRKSNIIYVMHQYCMCF